LSQPLENTLQPVTCVGFVTAAHNEGELHFLDGVSDKTRRTALTTVASGNRDWFLIERQLFAEEQVLRRQARAERESQPDKREDVTQ
jgi:hypothetical protein